LDRKALGRLLYGAAGLMVGGAALYVSLRDVAWDTLVHSFEGVRWLWLAAAVIVSMTVAFLKAVRWHRLLVPDLRNMPWSLTFAVLILSHTLNLLVPVRGLGETARVGLLAQKTDGHALRIGGTLILEKFLDVLSLVVLAVILSPMLVEMIDPVWISRLLIVTGVMGVGLLLIVRFQRSVRVGLRRWPTLSTWLHKLLSGLDAVKSQARIGELAGWTIAIRAVSAVSLLFALRAARLSLPLRGLLTLDILFNLSFLLPAPPGMIGVIQYIAILVLGLFDIRRTQALVAGVLLNIVIVSPVLLLTVPSWFRVMMTARRR
jgi:hypothetical protein